MKHLDIAMDRADPIYPDLDPIDRLWTYWNSLRTTGAVPSRDAISPLALGALLQYAFVAEYNPFCGAKFRVVGESVNEFLGFDVQGMPIGCLLTPSLRAQFVDHSKHVFEAPATLHADFSASAQPDTPSVTAQVLLLPLADEAGLVRQALGCWVIEGDMGSNPRHFDTLAGIELDVLVKRTPPIKKAAPMERPSLSLVQ